MRIGGKRNQCRRPSAVRDPGVALERNAAFPSFAGMVTALEHDVGQIVAALEERGLYWKVGKQAGARTPSLLARSIRLS
jgi:hypothetical protein